jgi:tetratricopeptide (TPR) repeat protein
LQTAYEAAEQLLRLGQNTQDPALIVEGHHGLGQISYYMGKFTAARDHLEQAIALHDSGAATSTINRELSVLKRAFNLGLQAEKIVSKPYIPMLTESNVRTGFFEYEEFLAVRRRCRLFFGL